MDPPPPSENLNFLNSQSKVTKIKPWIWVYLNHEMLSYEVHLVMKVEIKKKHILVNFFVILKIMFFIHIATFSYYFQIRHMQEYHILKQLPICETFS